MKPTILLIALLCGGLALTTATAHADRYDHEVAVTFVPLNLVWYNGDHADGALDESASDSIGLNLSYMLDITEHWSLGARTSIVRPSTELDDNIYDMNGALVVRWGEPFANNRGYWSVGGHAGGALLNYRGDTPSGWLLGANAGVRVHIGSDLWLALDGTADLTLTGGANIFRLGQFGIGMAYRPGPDIAEELPLASGNPLFAKSTISGMVEVSSYTAVAAHPLPLLGVRFTHNMFMEGLSLEARLASIVYQSTAALGAVYEFTQGAWRPHAFGRIGAMLGLEDTEVALSTVVGVGLSHTAPRGLFWIVDAGVGVMADVRGELSEDQALDGFVQVSIGIGVRR